MRHDPTFLNANRHGAWATCTCGWRSRTYREQMGAQIEYGQHLTDTTNPTAPNSTRKA